MGTQAGLEQSASSRVQPLNCNQQGWNDQVLIPFIQALQTTAVDQDLVQRELTELHQQALPQQAGNNTPQLSQQDTSHKQPSKPKGKNDKVEVVCSSFASNSSSTQEYSGPNSKKGNRKQSTIPCKDFNEGKCQKNYGHEVGLITHKHIFNFCLYSLNKQYNHSENVCNRKRVKNGQGVHQ